MAALRPVKAVLLAVLKQAVATLEELDRPVPPRRYLAAGAGAEDIVWDCAQLAVVPAQIRQAPVAAAGTGAAQLTRRRGGDALARVLDLQVQLVRMYPVPNRNGQPPSAEKLGEAGETLADDLAAMTAVLDACVLNAAVGERTMVAPGLVQAVGPLADTVGVVGGLSVALMNAPV